MNFFNEIYQPENAYQDMMLHLAIWRSRVQDREEKRRKKVGLTIQQFNFLLIVSVKHPEPVSPSSIKDALIFKTSDLTRLVDRLVKKELLIRFTNPENRRQVSIQLTESGVKLVKEEMEFIHKNLLDVCADISEEEARTFVKILKKLKI